MHFFTLQDALCKHVYIFVFFVSHSAGVGMGGEIFGTDNEIMAFIHDSSNVDESFLTLNLPRFRLYTTGRGHGWGGRSIFVSLSAENS